MVIRFNNVVRIIEIRLVERLISVNYWHNKIIRFKVINSKFIVSSVTNTTMIKFDITLQVWI